MCAFGNAQLSDLMPGFAGPAFLSGAVESSLCPAAKQTDLVTLCCHFSFQTVMFYPPGPPRRVSESAGDVPSQQGSVIGDVLKAPWAETKLFGFICRPEVRAAHKMATRP